MGGGEKPARGIRSEQAGAIDHRMIKAFAHPLRARALMILSDRVASPKEIAEETAEPLGKVSYHVRELEKAGLIELAATDGSRGGVQHFYRSTQEMMVLTEDETSEQSLAERQTGSAVIIHLILADVGASVAAGTFDARNDRHLSRTAFPVDEEGWRQLHHIYDVALAAAMKVRTESAERLAASGKSGFPIRTSALVFEMPAT